MVIAFDWQRFLTSYGIEFVVGPAENVRRGHIGFACPRCPRDEANHYGINVETGSVRGCWRDPGHWMSPVELIATVAGCTWDRARQMLELQETSSVGTTARALLAQLEAPGDTRRVLPLAATLRMPKGFQGFHERPSAQQRPFDEYLAARGFEEPWKLTRDYGLRWCAARGSWRNRIIFPLWRDGRLVAWSARAIGHALAKYKAEPPGDTMQNLLWESREVEPWDLLVVVEGPFDALKIAAALDDRVVAVALMTNSAGPAKLARIIELSGCAKRTIILLDYGAEAQALTLQTRLAIIKPTLLFCPQGVKDPGDMSLRHIRALLRDFL